MREDKARDMLSVTVYDGKYTVIQDARGGLRALRHGQEWRECTGDGLILALAQEVEALLEALNSLANEASGIVSMDENALRESVGNTNVNCLKRRIDEACAAIAKATGAKAVSP